jgi:glycosyltransferase involved in cell wall biosynthesis
VRPLRILYAVETLLPARGGAERFALEWLGELAQRHGVRALYLVDDGVAADAPPGVSARPVPPPPPVDGYWRTKRTRRGAVGDAVRAELAVDRADVVVTALHAAPGVVTAATGADVPAVLMLYSYESLCKYAFDAGSECVPESRCRDCPASAALPPAERDELLRSRGEHERALAESAALVAETASVADAFERWCGRRPALAPGAAPIAPVRADPRGHVQLAAARWIPNKGLHLLEPLADALGGRPVAITDSGLDPARAERLRNRPGVRVVSRAPIRELLDGAAALLVPSQWPEPFGRLAFEGLAAGVPTLAAAVGGLPEYVPREQLVDPPDSIRHWREAVEALEDLELWSSARERGRAAAEAVLAMRSAERIESVLRAVAR